MIDNIIMKADPMLSWVTKRLIIPNNYTIRDEKHSAKELYLDYVSFCSSGNADLNKILSQKMLTIKLKDIIGLRVILLNGYSWIYVGLEKENCATIIAQSIGL